MSASMTYHLMTTQDSVMKSEMRFCNFLPLNDFDINNSFCFFCFTLETVVDAVLDQWTLCLHFLLVVSTLTAYEQTHQQMDESCSSSPYLSLLLLLCSSTQQKHNLSITYTSYLLQWSKSSGTWKCLNLDLVFT